MNTGELILPLINSFSLLSYVSLVLICMTGNFFKKLFDIGKATCTSFKIGSCFSWINPVCYNLSFVNLSFISQVAFVSNYQYWDAVILFITHTLIMVVVIVWHDTVHKIVSPGIYPFIWLNISDIKYNHATISTPIETIR